MKRTANYSENHFVSDDTAYTANAEKRRENLRALFNYTTIVPFKWKSKYACYYCSEQFTDYVKLKKHTKSHGPCSKKTLKHLKTTSEVKLDVSEMVCELCQKEFKSLDKIVDHLIMIHCKVYDKTVDIDFQEYRLSDLKCLHCDQRFSHFAFLASHVHSAHSNRFECDHCGCVFSKEKNIVVHINTHHAVGAPVCKLCDKIFVDKARLKRHNDHRHYAGKKYQCSHCNLTFKYTSNMKKHIANHHSGAGLSRCGNCSKELPSTEEMQLHLSICDGGTQTTNANTYRKRNNHCNQIRRNIQCVLNMSTAVPFKFKSKFSCFYCSHCFSHFEELIVHTRAEHPVCELKSKALRACKGEKACVKLDINGISCKLCQQPMSDLSTFVDHAIANHGADYEKSIPFKACFEAFHITQGRIQCPECQEPFAYFATLLRHLGAAHNHHKAVCAYCGRGFRNTTGLAMHIRNSHTGMCECAICNAKCKNSDALARHMARYHDAKEHKCSQCPEQFETMYKKQNHMIKAHNVGHKCAYCGKMFTRNSFMMNHIRRTHLKERTVPCSICNVKFFDSYQMGMHMVKHEGVRRFRCEDCGKSFLRLRNLKSHMDTHKKSYAQEGFHLEDKDLMSTQ